MKELNSNLFVLLLGVKESLIQCVHIADEGPVSDTLCDITTRPDIFTQVCNEQPCPPE